MNSDDNSQQYKIRNKSVDAIHAEIGKRIAKYRKSQGLSQEQLATMSDIDRSHMGFIEQGRRNPTIATLQKVTRSLKITLEELFRGL
jgi:transcriptional regulator with XRE-family HTH domain